MTMSNEWTFIEQHTSKEGVIVEIHQDPYPEDPRNFAEYGELLIAADGYSLGDDGKWQMLWDNLVKAYASYHVPQSLASVFVSDGDWLDSSKEVDWDHCADLQVMIPVEFLDYGSSGQRLNIGEPIVGTNECRLTLSKMLDCEEGAPNGLLVATGEDIGSKDVDDYIRRMQMELSEYKAYVEGEICYFTINNNPDFGWYSLDECRKAALAALEEADKKVVKERAEKKYWEERDVTTK